LSAAGCRATSDPLRNRGDARLVPLRRAANGVGLSSELRWSVTVDNNSVFDVCVSHHRHRHGATDPLQHRTGSSFIVIIVIIVILDIIITD